MKTNSTIPVGRIKCLRPPMTRIGAALTALLLILAFGQSSEVVQATSTTWSATLTSAEDDSDDQWGYEEDDFGTMSPTSFLYGGNTYIIEDLKWDESGEYIEFVTTDA